MNNAYRDHLIEIAKCEHFLNCEGTPCQKIVESQEEEDKQLPEPWNGDIQNARILFISSNPSIDPEEEFPTTEWNEDEIVDFFHHRFSKNRKYVKDYSRVLLKNGEYTQPQKWVRYWASIRRFSERLLEKEIIPGVDYAITEIVRCKSRKEFGVVDAISACSDKFLEKTIKLSNADILIAVGAQAKNKIQEKFNIIIPDDSCCKISIGNTQRIVSAIHHPNSWGEKNYEIVIKNIQREIM